MRTAEQSLRLRTKVLALLVVLLLLFSAGNWLIQRSERAECVQWSQELQEHPQLGEHIAGWQSEQCEELGVPLPALP